MLKANHNLPYSSLPTPSPSGRAGEGLLLVILGAGESGVGTAILGKKRGYDVFVSDFGAIKPQYKQELDQAQIAWEEKKHTADLILNADLVMKSPGIPDTSLMVKQILEKGIQIISEIEFAAPFTTAKTIGITGSNGKTTTTLLTYHLLKAAGLHVGLGGNIGKSFARQVAENDFEYYVLELSSFQLDGCYNYAPHIAIITNISPDHLDRYDYKYENYIASKFRITQKQTTADFLIYDADDAAISNWLQNNNTNAQLIPFSLVQKPQKGAYIKENNMIVNIAQEDLIFDTTEFALEGKHNMKNAMAAATTASLLQMRKQTIRESMSNFQGVEHRLEKVLKVQGVQYINDSKATNVNAAFFALDSIKTPTVWIVGGVDKGNDYNELMSLVREKVKAIVCLGTNNQKIIDTFGNVVDMMVEVGGMRDAVTAASHLSEKGDTVLLAPACASFDLFENYEDRGRQFKAEVHNL